MKTTTISDFRANIKKYIDFVIDASSSVIINRGNSAAVLISLDEYNAIKETERIKSSEELANKLKSCLEDMELGKGMEINLEDL